MSRISKGSRQGAVGKRMASITLGEVLSRVEKFEERRARFYADVRDQSSDNGVRLLAYYLARHRRNQERVFDDLQSQDVDKARHIRIPRDAPAFPDADPLLRQVSPGKASGRDLLNAAISYNTQLVRLYASILMVPQSLDATFLILSLIKIEAEDIQMLEKMSDSHYF